MQNDMVTRVRLGEAVASRDLPPEYFERPIVKSSESLVLPISLFIDAVPYSQSDSCVGFGVVNKISKARHLVAVLRKHRLCGCGCRGWD